MRGTNDSQNDTRRAFLGSMAVRAAYVTPVVLTLSVRRAHAGVSGCGGQGSSCYTDADCCPDRVCLMGNGQPPTMGMNAMCKLP